MRYHLVGGLSKCPFALWKITHWTGRLQPGLMITRKIKLDEIEENGYKALETDNDGQVKILMEVSP